MEDERPLFRQVAELVEQAIVDGSLQEDERVPSTNELAAFHRINPATAAKGLQVLVAEGIVTRKRGLGMYVLPGAREKLLQRRRDAFGATFVAPMLAEARTLGIDHAALLALVEEVEAR